MSQNYDDIAESFAEGIDERLDRARIHVPTIQKYLGNVQGREILDLGCGTGYFTRHIKRWGASRVVGVDRSKKMIEIASQTEAKQPLGIDYRMGDAASIGKVGKFDFVVAAFLLHYADTEKELTSMCSGIAGCLKPGGRLVCLNENPFHPVHSGVQYNVTAQAEGAIRDGTRIERAHFLDGKERFTLRHFHYEPATYARALKAAGFRNIQWLPFVRGKDAEEGLPKGYWDAYVGDFSIRVLLGEV